jgi:hypothetical protein
MTSPAAATVVPLIQRPEHKVAAHIRDAAEATGVPFEFLLAQANQESRLDPNARNRRSSATGLFQFTAGTWLDMVKRHGAEHGLDQYADAIVKGPDGRLTIKDKDFRKEVLDLRSDPRLSAVMAGEYAKDNEKVLEAKLGRQVSTHDLYLAHFLGAGGAIKVLKNLTQPAGDAHPPELAGAAQANPEVFNNAEGEANSLATIYRGVEKRFRRAMADAATMANSLRPRVDLAALKPDARPAEPGSPQSPEIGAAALLARELAPAIGAVAVNTAFPTTLPPRTAMAAPPDDADGLGFPIRMPPPVAGVRADATTLRGLLAVMEDKS